MATIRSNAASYLGSTAMLRPGDRVPAALPVTADPALALANAWRLAGAGNRLGTPHVYELTDDSQALVVVAEMAVTAELAGRAMTMSGNLLRVLRGEASF
jgi:hypothetical protein